MTTLAGKVLGRLKTVLPDHPVPVRILRGPFRGARVVMNPRSSLRKVFGLYEHEINGWLELALSRVSRVVDVGANDGYFTFGSAAAFQRLGIKGEIIGFEPGVRHVETLRKGMAVQNSRDVLVEIVQSVVGRKVSDGVTTLDALRGSDRSHTLIKIDVEGAELDVMMGAQSWLNALNFFVIEVHKEDHLGQLRRMFSEHGLTLVQINQHPLPLLGREERQTTNWWLVSDLGKHV